MKAMISQSMLGLSDKVIKNERNRVINYLETLGYDVVDSFIEDEPPKEIAGHNITLWYLGESLKRLALCDTLYCCSGWEQTRGCILEHDAAKAYDLNILYE